MKITMRSGHGHFQTDTRDNLTGRVVDDLLRQVLGQPGPSSWALLDFPAHTNVGDSAIWLGTLSIMENHFGQRPSYVTRARQFPTGLKQFMPEGPIFLLGGGNFGDVWAGHWEHRVELLRRFHDRKIVQLPQSIHFQDLDGEALRQTRSAIADHPDFVLMVRDDFSMAFATTYFECPVVLCPDFAYGLGEFRANFTPTDPISALLRDDRERSLESFDTAVSGSEIPINDWIHSNKPPLSVRLLPKLTGWMPFVLGPLAKPLNAAFCAWGVSNLARGLDLLGSAEVVITDRLHGHILCSLLQKPHVVMNNANGKVFGYLETWPDDGLTWSATNLDQAIDIARGLRT